MPLPPKKHPAIRLVAWLSILGGLLTMGWSLNLLHTALEQQNWPSAQVVRGSTDNDLHYRVGERHFQIEPATDASTLPLTVVFYDPAKPDSYIFKPSNYWWPLYLSMAGLIVLYAGLHLQRERHRDVQQLGFE